MNSRKSLRRTAFFLAISPALLSQAALSSVLMLDFGTTTVAGTADLANSPYHTENSGFTDTTWNKITISSATNTSLTWSDGTAATTVSLNQLKSAGSTSTSSQTYFRGAANSSGNYAGTSVNTGVYSGTSVGSDGFTFDSTIANNRGIGIQLLGLPSGTYDIYFTGRNTNYGATAYNMNLYAGVGNKASGTSSGANDLNLGSDGFLSQTNSFANATDKVSAWTFTSGNAAASNYAKFTLTIDASNPYLNLIALGDSGSAMASGALNSIQIVSVPEPSAAVILCGSLGILAMRRRRNVPAGYSAT